ncbi:LuxR family transcriptional regulator [Paraburkholderia sp. BL8N3]|nr:LuxR family transcriptional regulator [Paraburkholderia sp. BL8N3]TCK33792.1 LuxR family transcriptional regulator [Paraburkholderia sp. BL8N3]
MDNFFAKIGQAITDSGTDDFVAGIHSLINDYVPVDVTEATDWVLDEKSKKVTSVQCLGAWGTGADWPGFWPSPAHSRGDAPEPPICGQIVNAEDSQLIHLKPREIAGDLNARVSATVYQCILLYRQDNRRQVISLYRSAQSPRDFLLRELSALKQLSDAILPAVGHHARKRARAPKREVAASTMPVPAKNQAKQVQRSFDQRLGQMGVTLSSREYQVCLAYLLGNTLPTIARQLSVRESSAATYFRRAGIKLNLSGRHGFAKWMLGTASGN